MAHILIVMLFWGKPAMTSIAGFASEAACKAAGESLMQQHKSGYGTVEWYCVPTTTN